MTCRVVTNLIKQLTHTPPHTQPLREHLCTVVPSRLIEMPKPKKIDPKAQARTTPSPNTPTIPNWPPLRPLLPAADLSLVPLVPDQIYLIQNFLSSSLCKTYASFLASLPLTTTPGKPKKDEAVRVNDRFQVQDARFAEMLWSGTALKELATTRFADEEAYTEDGEYEPPSAEELAKKAKEVWGGEPLGLNPNIRIYRYSTGQFFAQHCEWSSMTPDIALEWTWLICG